jgi:hypothetical protein
VIGEVVGGLDHVVSRGDDFRLERLTVAIARVDAPPQRVGGVANARQDLLDLRVAQTSAKGVLLDGTAAGRSRAGCRRRPWPL